MLKLHTRDITALGTTDARTIIARITMNSQLPMPLRSQYILVASTKLDAIPLGFLACFTFDSTFVPDSGPRQNVFLLPHDQSFLGEGDVVRFNAETRSLRVIYRKDSKHNSFLVTERCNNFCLMCSQPPKQADDSYLIDELMQAIPLMDRTTSAVGITGGEPTLLGNDLIRIIRALKHYLPHTGVHVLSNGRRFKDLAFADAVSAIQHHDLMIGIPVYSDVSQIHDYVVQADGAFDDTIRGIVNLKRCGVRVEIRVVVHKQTYERLPQLAMFISRNLLFVDHVALMGLEMMGFTKYNLDELWIDPIEYQPQLVQAVEVLTKYGLNVSIYNHQLCVLDRRVWPFNRKSISDWKNEYMDTCEPCIKKSECGGFFSSARLRYSDHIRPFIAESSSER